ncbi:uncharacterized protein syt18b isoform X1 [Nerophis lumbriciformis]|uniref:uncharacterized protein syt18b isoform X1 n=1 Tax=Nerophis lumbriciformis TaxID=546530 RepID=UPI002ADFEBB9|nr:uncharacterized protein syt18b isoform X1 [Nerophis lumbriciformis]
MPYHDEEYPGQPLWRSVVLFCSKGMIEVIMVILFFWLLVQVLFTKQLEVNLQILLLVGLVAFCLSLLLGCVLCCWRSRICCDDKETFDPDPAAVSSPRRQYEELDGDTLDYPSTFASPAAFEPGLTSWSFSSKACDRKESFFSLRRLSTPLLTPPLYEPMGNSRASLPSFPKLLSKRRQTLQRRCTVTGDSFSSEPTHSPSTPEELIPLVPLNQGFKPSPTRCLRFTMLFSPEGQTLTIRILSLTGWSHSLEDASVLGCLPPLHPSFTHASVHGGLKPILLWTVRSAEELQKCTLKIAVYAQDQHGRRGSVLGDLQTEFGGRDWGTGCEFHFAEELQANKWPPEKVVTTHT